MRERYRVQVQRQGEGYWRKVDDHASKEDAVDHARSVAIRCARAKKGSLRSQVASVSVFDKFRRRFLTYLLVHGLTDQAGGAVTRRAGDPPDLGSRSEPGAARGSEGTPGRADTTAAGEPTDLRIEGPVARVAGLPCRP